MHSTNNLNENKEINTMLQPQRNKNTELNRITNQKNNKQVSMVKQEISETTEEEVVQGQSGSPLVAEGGIAPGGHDTYCKLPCHRLSF